MRGCRTHLTFPWNCPCIGIFSICSNKRLQRSHFSLAQLDKFGNTSFGRHIFGLPTVSLLTSWGQQRLLNHAKCYLLIFGSIIKNKCQDYLSSLHEFVTCHSFHCLNRTLCTSIWGLYSKRLLQ